jgi:hypothetical protein
VATKAKRQRKGEYKVSSTILTRSQVMFFGMMTITNLKFELAWIDFFGSYSLSK